MGCFLSLLSRDDNDPSDATGETEQQQQPCRTHPTVPDTIRSHRPAESSIDDNNRRGSRSSRRSGQASDVPLSEHYNEPIRQHVWYSKRRLWNRAQLDQERKEFFETRVTGRPEIWAALSTAVTLMQTGDLSTAQGIIDAAGVTVPTGDLCEGCYDEQGVLYRLPQCIVSDPENITETVNHNTTSENDDDNNAAISSDGVQEMDADDAMSDAKLASDGASADELISDDIERRRDEKGKTSERDLIKVKARLSDRGGPDVVLAVGKTQSVGYIARKVQQEASIPGHQRVRIAYLGKILKENDSLPDQGWKIGHVVNALVVARGSASWQSPPART